MKTKVLLLSTAFLFALNVMAQKVGKSNVNYKTFTIPSVPVTDVSTVGFKIYSVYDGLNASNLKVKKLEYAEEKTNERKRFFLNEIAVTEGTGDLSIEVAYGQIAYGEKKVKQWQAPCVRDDGNLTKDDIKKCPAFYYEIPYTLPAAYQVKDKSGKVVFAEVFDAEGTTQWGKSDLNPYLDKAKLITDWTTNNREKLVTHKLHTSRIENFFEQIDDVLYFEKFKHSFSFGTGKGKDFDYTDQTSAMEKAAAVFDAEDPDFSLLTESITIWEKELESADIGNKSARVNKKVARELHSNLAIAYMYQNDYVKAVKHARRNNKLSSQGSKLFGEINRRYIAYKINGDLELPEKMVKAKDFKILVDAVRKENNFFTFEDKSAEIIENANQFKAQFEEEMKEDKEELTEESAAGENPYRAMIMSNPTQGNYMMLNSFTNADLVGQAVPSQIAELKELNQFRAYGMKMTSLPENLGNLSNLNKLDLANNNITELPASIGQLSNLQNLILTNNPIENLPEELKQCTKLKSLKLKGTKVSADQIAAIQAALPKCKIK